MQVKENYSLRTQGKHYRHDVHLRCAQGHQKIDSCGQGQSMCDTCRGKVETGIVLSKVVNCRIH